MPRSRRRGGTRMPRSGDETTLPAMLISPEVGCSSPATQRSVVVLPQPEGPSRTTISPAGTAKLTPSIAGRPIANCLRRSVTSSVAVMGSAISRTRRSLRVTVGLVPISDPRRLQLHILIELGEPDLDHFGVKTFWVGRRHLQRRQIAEFLDHEGLPLFGQTPVEKQFCSIGVRGGLWNARRIGIDRRAFRRKEDLDRRAVLLLWVNR